MRSGRLTRNEPPVDQSMPTAPRNSLQLQITPSDDPFDHFSSGRPKSTRRPQDIVEDILTHRDITRPWLHMSRSAVHMGKRRMNIISPRPDLGPELSKDASFDQERAHSSQV